MKEKKHRERIPKTEVLDWLQKNHPALHATAEVDREWIWLVANLKGDANKATRESIKEFGFIFSRHGGHHLPSGKVGTWGHSCTKPMPFKHKGKGTAKGRAGANSKCNDPSAERIDPVVQAQEATNNNTAVEDWEALAALVG